MISVSNTDPFLESHLKSFNDILKNATCFYPEAVLEKDGKKGKVISNDFRLCKISKK